MPLKAGSPSAQKFAIPLSLFREVKNALFMPGALESGGPDLEDIGKCNHNPIRNDLST